MMPRLAHLRSALQETFSRSEGWITAAAGFLSVLLLASIFSNLKLLSFILREEAFDAGLKLKSVFQTLWNSRVFLLHGGGFSVVLLAALFGLNAALLARYLRHQARMRRAAGASAIGMLVGLFGAGCAACGSALLAGLLGVGGVVAALPLRGQEFTWLGILLILISTLSLARRIAEPEACALPKKP